MPVEYIRNLSDSENVIEEMPQDESMILLSIGRFCTAKILIMFQIFAVKS